ncbi:MAG: DUF2191 domain-containing protein [Thermoleophilia bacterium]
MKTTIDIATPLLEQAKSTAAEEGTTLKRLVEEGLRLALERRAEGPRFVLRDASFGGDGVQPGVDLTQWDQLRDAIYRGRGT